MMRRGRPQCGGYIGRTAQGRALQTHVNGVLSPSELEPSADRSPSRCSTPTLPAEVSDTSEEQIDLTTEDDSANMDEEEIYTEEKRPDAQFLPEDPHVMEDRARSIEAQLVREHVNEVDQGSRLFLPTFDMAYLRDSLRTIVRQGLSLCLALQQPCLVWYDGHDNSREFKDKLMERWTKTRAQGFLFSGRAGMAVDYFTAENHSTPRNRTEMAEYDFSIPRPDGSYRELTLRRITDPVFQRRKMRALESLRPKDLQWLADRGLRYGKIFLHQDDPTPVSALWVSYDLAITRERKISDFLKLNKSDLTTEGAARRAARNKRRSDRKWDQAVRDNKVNLVTAALCYDTDSSEYFRSSSDEETEEADTSARMASCGLK